MKKVNNCVFIWVSLNYFNELLVPVWICKLKTKFNLYQDFLLLFLHA